MATSTAMTESAMKPSTRTRDHDPALAWRFAAVAPASAASNEAPSLRFVRALAMAVACACLFFVVGLT